VNRTYEQIHDHVMSLEIVDTHEHLPYREEAREKNTDVLREYLQHYFNRDLMSAGLSEKQYEKVMDHRVPLLERWDIVEPYWNVARHTGYGRSLDIAVRELYGIPRIDRSTIERLDREFQASLAPGHFRKVLKEKSRIAVSILDSNLECDRTFFRSTCNVDRLVRPRNLKEIKAVAAEAGVTVGCLDDWLEACVTIARKSVDRGAVCFKHSLAYVRPISHRRPTRAEAETAFAEFFAAVHVADGDTLGAIPGLAMQDFTAHGLLAEANRRGWVWQVHTGLLEGSGNLLGNSDPLLLAPLLLEYPGVRFDLFHIGYPWHQQLSALAKMFPNVTIDMCWAHIISPTACVEALCEWIDAVPLNKISAFGGDYLFVDGVYGHQAIARHNVSASLARKVDEGVLGIDDAREAARLLFVDNPRRIFGLG
jgi:hypothetical protein